MPKASSLKFFHRASKIPMTLLAQTYLYAQSHEMEKKKKRKKHEF